MLTVYLCWLMNQFISFFGDFPIVFETAYTSPTMFFALTELLFANYHNYQQKKLFQQGNQNYAE